MTAILLPLLLAVSAAAQAADAPATEQSVAEESAIPFVSSDGIQDFRADGARGLYIRGGNGAWYYARTQGDCARLPSAISLGFETNGADQLDRFGAIRVQGWRCPLESVARSAAPPKKAKKAD